MQKTKQQIFEAMRSDIIKRKPATPDQKPSEKDQFADLVSKLKAKKKAD